MSRQVAGSRQRTLTWAMMPGWRPSGIGRAPARRTPGAAYSLDVGAAADHAYAATSSGIPASVMANTAAVTVAVNAMPNSTQLTAM